MPVRNGAATIEAQLAALSAQTFRRPWEVVVVNDASTDDTAAIAMLWINKVPRLSILSLVESRGESHARNVGTRASRGPLVAYCDADDVVSEKWLENIVQPLSQHAMATGPIDLSQLNPIGRYSWRRASRIAELPRWMGFLAPVVGCNMAVRRETFDLMGGFDELLVSGQDYDFAFRVQLAGESIGFAPHALVHQRLRAGWSYFRRSFEYGLGHVELYRRFRDKGLRPQRIRGAARLVGAGLGAPLALVPKYRYGWLLLAGMELGRLKGSTIARMLFL